MPLPVTRSGNPSLNERVFASQPRVGFGAERMTLQGSINKAFLLLVVLLEIGRASCRERVCLAV